MCDCEGFNTVVLFANHVAQIVTGLQMIIPVSKLNMINLGYNNQI